MVDQNLFLHDLAVVAIMKNEGPYLKEWLDYHLLAGVDHFYIYDNDSPDNQREVAAPYDKAGLVDYISAPGKLMQFPVYNDAVKRFKFHCRYMSFIDGDEFIFPKVGTGGAALSMSSTKFYCLIQTRQAWKFLGKSLAPTVKRKLTIHAAC